jgi:hypothetical protein
VKSCPDTVSTMGTRHRPSRERTSRFGRKRMTISLLNETMAPGDWPTMAEWRQWNESPREMDASGFLRSVMTAWRGRVMDRTRTKSPTQNGAAEVVGSAGAEVVSLEVGVD